MKLTTPDFITGRFDDRLAVSNTYKTLLIRCQKGCYVYCEDEALREYLKKMIR